MIQRDSIQIHNSKTVFKKQSYSGLTSKYLNIANGARIVFTMHIFSIDPGATVSAKVKTTFSDEMPAYEVMALTADSVGPIKGVLSDFHSLVDVDLEVANGNAEVILGINVFDNALTTRIENAEISVDINDKLQPNGNYDSVRIGDGVEILSINPDGSINVNIVDSQVVPENVKPVFNKITNVVDSIRTSVVSHTAVLGKKTYLQYISVNGNNIANYEVEIGGIVIDERSTSFGGPLAEQFELKAYSQNGMLISEGIKIEVFTTHYRQETGDFSSRIQILEVG